MVSLPGGKLWWEVRVEEEKKKRKERGEEEHSTNYDTTPSFSPTPSLRAEMMYGCKGHMLAV